MTTLRTITDDGVHWEHVVVSSVDAERAPDGELRVRLLRPLQRVRALRLVYAELPKTTRTLDLMIDVGTQAGRLVTQQVARSIRSNENDTQQRQTFGRIFVQDYDTTDFFNSTAKYAFQNGAVPRFLYENENRNYMRYEFRPAINSMQLMNLRLYSALLDNNGIADVYRPDLHVVTIGSDLIDRGAVLVNTDTVALTIPLVTQPASTVIRLATAEEYQAHLNALGDILTVADLISVDPLETDYEAGVAFLSPLLEQIAIDVNGKGQLAPVTSLAIQDGTTPTLDDYGIIQSPCMYSIKTIPSTLKTFLFESKAYSLGKLHVYSWLTKTDASYTTDKPDFPFAFRAEDFEPPTPADKALELNIQTAAIGRCILEVESSFLQTVLNTQPIMVTNADSNTRRCKLKYLLKTCLLRTIPQTRPVHGVLNDSLRAELLNLYEVQDVFIVDATLDTKFRDYILSSTGRTIANDIVLFAIELKRSIDPMKDVEGLRKGGTDIDLLAFKNRYRIDNGNGFSVPWQLDTLMTATFPVTLTFEAEIAQKER